MFQAFTSKPSRFKLALAFLLPLVGKGSEAWLLETDASYAAAWRTKIESADAAQRREALDSLPGLVASGRIRELERVEQKAGQTVALRNRQRSVTCRKDPLKGQTLLLGTTLEVRPEAKEERSFRIRTEGEGLGADLYLVTQGKLGSSWQPSLLWMAGDKARIYLERDPSAPSAQIPVAALLQIKVAGPRSQESVWFLQEGHPLLARATQAQRAPAKGGRPTLSFWDCVTSGKGPSGQLVNFGPRYSLFAESSQAVRIDLAWQQEAARAKLLYNNAVAKLTVTAAGVPAQTSYQAEDVEFLKDKGQLKSSNPSEGNLQATLTLLPAASPSSLTR